MSNITRRDVIVGLATCALLPLLPGCVTRPGATGAVSGPGVRALLDDIAYRLLQLQPEGATSLGVDKGEHSDLRSRLTDSSASGMRAIAQTLRADLARAVAVDTSTLDFRTRTAIEVVKSAYRTALEGFALPYGDVAVGGWRNSPYVVIQNAGAYLDVPRFLDSQHLVANVTDAEAWIERLSQYPAVLDGELGRIRDARTAGLVPPAFLLDKTIQQISLSIEGAHTGGSMVESITGKTRNIPGNWAGRARRILQQDVAPALERQLNELQQQRAIATNDPGMRTRPHGEEYYRWALMASTTTTMPPEQVHELGLEQLEIMHGRMDPILKDLDYSQGSVGERMQALARDPRYQFPPGDAGRKEILAFIDERLTNIRMLMPEAFNTLVNARLEVRRLPVEEEPGAPSAYGGPGSIDGTIPGKFWVNLRTTDLYSRYSLPDLAYHEAIPGHVWQGEYTHKLPLIQSVLTFNAYSEGWALYAEQLADELGVYKDFPVGRLGYLQSIAFRACRLVVDTGLHSMRWTREQAVRFFVDVNGSNPLEVANEVDRYCSWPGQACGYEVGHQEINRLRLMARSELGADYDLRSFNDRVVLGGNVPLDVLALNVDNYIHSAKH